MLRARILVRSFLRPPHLSNPRHTALSRHSFTAFRRQAGGPRFHFSTSPTSPKRFRPWLFDEFAFLFSWLFVGNALFILVGTTSAASTFLFLANSLDFQGISLLN
jgi:hypothetical protein